MPKTHTVILGGGFGGIATAVGLRRALPKEHRITVVDRSERFVVGASHVWVMLGQSSVDGVTSSRRALAAQGIDCVFEEIRSLDPAARTVQTAGQQLRADHLVIALGAELRPERVPGLQEAAETFYTVDGAHKLHERLRTFEAGDIVFLVPRAPFKCPPAPYEAALSLHDDLVRRGRRSAVRMGFYTVEPAPMPTAGPVMGQFITGLLASASIAYHPRHKAEAVDPGQRLVRFEGGAEAKYDLLIAVPPHEAPAVVKEAGLLGDGGWIPVDPSTLKTRFESVWAIGDVSSVPLPGRFKPEMPLMLPKAGVFAAGHGRAVAAQIAAKVLEGKAPAAFDGKGFCYLETEHGKATRGDGEFFAMPAPKAAPAGPPSAELLEQKRQWVARWRSMTVDQ